MTAATYSIVQAFEELAMTPEEIAEDQEVELASVKAILMQNSSKYRKTCKKDADFCFTDDEGIAAKQVIANLMRYSDDENLRFRAAKYLLDDKKGRLDIVKEQTGLNINILQFNQHMKEALEAVKRSKEQLCNSAAINIESRQLANAK